MSEPGAFPPVPNLLLATRNPGKIGEITALLEGIPMRIISLADIQGIPEVDEDGKTLEVNVTVEDPGAFNAPWSAIARYRRATSPQPLTEQPCAENNLDLLNNYGTPTATKSGPVTSMPTPVCSGGT